MLTLTDLSVARGGLPVLEGVTLSLAPGEVLLGFGAMDCDLNLSRAGDLADLLHILIKRRLGQPQPDVSGENQQDD